jgi:putative ABC transport system ATP-binding protein
VLQFQSLSKSYLSKSGIVHAVREASATVAPGELVALSGPSGSGKTTLLLMLGLVELPDNGTLILNGKSLVADGKPLADVRAERRLAVGYIFQRPNLVPFLNAIENILVIENMAAKRRKGMRDRAFKLMERLGIEHLHDRLPAQMSGGEQQRVAICRALINSPKLICADEPTASLDGKRAEGVVSALREAVTRQECAAIVSTHDARMLPLFDRVLKMDDGILREEARNLRNTQDGTGSKHDRC